MPLRDHFRPPVSSIASWEGFHGQWPAVIVQHLKKQLPQGFVAEPRAHAGSQIEIDVATFEKDEALFPGTSDVGEGGGVATATATWAPPQPSLATETTLSDDDEYEVRIYDVTRGRQLVAAIELVSPANKDRPEHRSAFIGKCAALLHQGIAVSIVDLVTVRQFNLYAELLAMIGDPKPSQLESLPHTYAVSCRSFKRHKRTCLEVWAHILTVGKPLPTLPLWLSDELVIPLRLEESYEQACNDLSIA